MIKKSTKLFSRGVDCLDYLSRWRHPDKRGVKNAHITYTYGINLYQHYFNAHFKRMFFKCPLTNLNFMLFFYFFFLMRLSIMV